MNYSYLYNIVQKANSYQLSRLSNSESDEPY